jgi:hypothetical protein
MFGAAVKFFLKKRRRQIQRNTGGMPTHASTPSRTRQGVHLTLKEVRTIIEIWELPPFLSAEQAAELYQRSVGVLRHHVSEGRFPQSAIVGKPLQFVTTRFIQEVAERKAGQKR